MSTDASRFEVADVWFGLQPTFPYLEQSLKEMVNKSNAAPNLV
jgi:hypothetical protein